jgi:pimeloyl-ACP methyl ester carboxylesterase
MHSAKLLKTAAPPLLSLALAPAAFALGWYAFSRARPRLDGPLPALKAERRAMMTRSGEAMSYYVDWRTPGRPLVIVHGQHAAASAHDMRPIFERYLGTRPIYAPDLPGFGCSERVDREYTPHLFAGAIMDIVERAKDQWGAADVVALSLSCEHAAMAAVRRPDLFRSLTMISPTGLSMDRRRRVPRTSGAIAPSGCSRVW